MRGGRAILRSKNLSKTFRGRIVLSQCSVIFRESETKPKIVDALCFHNDPGFSVKQMKPERGPQTMFFGNDCCGIIILQIQMGAGRGS